MKKELYDKIGTVSVKLSHYLKQLQDCENEKESLLQWIDGLKAKNELEQNASIVRKKMASNQARFEEVVTKIEQLKKSL